MEEKAGLGRFPLAEWMKWMKEKESMFLFSGYEVEVWDPASGQNHVLSAENQFFNLAHSQQEAHKPCLSCAIWQRDKRIVN